MGLSRFGGIGNGLGIVVALILDEVDFRALAAWAKNVVQRPSNPLAPGNRHIPLTAMISAVDSTQWRCAEAFSRLLAPIPPAAGMVGGLLGSQLPRTTYFLEVGMA